jgi:DNA anti-recombination protein RmuC
MTAKKKKPSNIVGMPFDEALARFLQTNPSEVADEFAHVKARQEEIRKDAEERKKLIKSSGRPAGKRFRL